MDPSDVVGSVAAADGVGGRAQTALTPSRRIQARVPAAAEEDDDGDADDDDDQLTRLTQTKMTEEQTHSLSLPVLTVVSW